LDDVQTVNSRIAEIAQPTLIDAFENETLDQFLKRQCGYADEALRLQARDLNDATVLESTERRTLKVYPCAYRSAETIVTVPAGNSTLGLAARFIGSDGPQTQARLKELNPGVDLNKLIPGQKLTFPFIGKAVSFPLMPGVLASSTDFLAALSDSPGVVGAELGSQVKLVPALKPVLSPAEVALCSGADSKWPIDSARISETLRRYLNEVSTHPERPISRDPAIAVIVDTGISENDSSLLNLATKRGERPSPPVADLDGNGYPNDTVGTNLPAKGGFPNAFSDYDMGYHGLAVSSVAGGTSLFSDRMLLKRFVELKQLSIVSRTFSTATQGAHFDIPAAGLAESLIYTRSLADRTPIIVNWSWESGSKDETVANVVSNGRELIVAAAGNSKRDVEAENVFPANFSNTNGAVLISVAALVPGNKLASFSGRGTSVTIAAPGCHVPVFRGGQQVVYEQGTSISAPLVTLATTIIKTLNQNADPLKLYNRIIATARRNPTLVGFVADGRVLDIETAISVYDDVVRLKSGTTIDGRVQSGTFTTAAGSVLPASTIYSIRITGGVTSSGTRPATALVAKAGERVREVPGGSLSEFTFVPREEPTTLIDPAEVAEIIPAMWRDSTSTALAH